MSGSSAHEEAEEREALARAEAEAALRAERAAHRGRPPTPTPDEAYAHLPVPARGPMITVAEMHINKETHRNFSTLCACVGNAKMKDVDSLFDREVMVSLSKYIIPLVRCKGFKQLQGRALSLKMTSEAVLVTRSASEAIKLIALKHIFSCQVGDPISADLKSREHFIDAELTTWMAQ